MVTGIMRGAAVAAITTVGTEAADIIMDGTGADIAGTHNIHHIHLGRPPRSRGGLNLHRMLFSE